jgi:copper chaperone CopZ
MKTETLMVKGMHCNSCEMIVKDVLEEMGVDSEVSHEKGVVKVTFNEAEKGLDEIKQAIRKEGYGVE